jgi:hypothetical protein
VIGEGDDDAVREPSCPVTQVRPALEILNDRHAPDERAAGRHVLLDALGAHALLEPHPGHMSQSHWAMIAR